MSNKMIEKRGCAITKNNIYLGDKLHVIKGIDNYKENLCCRVRLTIGPSSRPLAPSNCEPGLLIARTAKPAHHT